MKRFLLGTLGTLGLAGQLMAQPALMSNADGKIQAPAPTLVPAQPGNGSGPVIIENGNGSSNGNVIINGNGSSYDWENGDSGRGFSLMGGIEVLYLRPHFTRNEGLFVSQSDTTINVNQTGTFRQTNSNSNSSSIEFDYDWSISPRIWLGVQNDSGLGFRGIWFRFDQSADPIAATATGTGRNTNNNPAAPFPEVSQVTNVSTSSSTSSSTGGIKGTAPGSRGSILGTQAGVNETTDTFIPTNDTLYANTSLFMDVWDAEATLAGQAGCFDLVGSVERAYAFIEQTYNVFHPGVTGNTIAIVGGVPVVQEGFFRTDTQLSRQTFTGAGPTAALEVLRRLGDGGRLALYGKSRGSILFGRGRQSTTVASFEQDVSARGVPAVTGILNSSSQTSSGGWDVLPVGEIEVAHQFGMGMGNASLFVRPAFVGQVWFDGGSAKTREGNFGLVGLSLTAGVGF